MPGENTITTRWWKNGVEQTPVTTRQNPGESEADWKARHMVALYEATNGQGADHFQEEALGLDLERDSGWSDTDFLREWDALLTVALNL